MTKGAAGGGKSYAQVIDAMLKALKYPGIRQLALRRTFPELEKSMIRLALQIYPKDIYKYNSTSHTLTFANGSVLDFGYCQTYQDAIQYQSIEYDIIRYDELTHFDPDIYTYLISRVRGTNGYPKQVKSSTNPGNRGHKFVKARFIDGHAPLQPFKDDLERTYKFIPALVTENKFLIESDPLYVKRLEQLPEAEREALLNGSWSAYTGMAFPEFNYNTHTCDPFEIPPHWRKWISCDNGYTDPFWWGWFTVSPDGIVYLYREFTRDYDDPKILYTEQAQKVIELMTHARVEMGEVIEEREKIDYIVAGVDAWNKHHRDQTGKDLIDMYAEGGLSGFVKAITDRKLRKSMFHEYLKPLGDHPFMTDKMGNPKPYSKLQIFRTCTGIISDLPDLIEDEKNPEMYADCSFDHSADGCGYSILSYHVNYTKPPKEEMNEIQKHKQKLAKAHTRRRR